SDPVHASTSGFCETQQTTPQTDFLPIREGRRKTALDLRRTPELKARQSWREVGVHVAVAEAMVGGKERIRKITRESLRRRRSSFRDVKKLLTSVYSLRVEEGKASMIAVLLIGSSACFEFRRS
ncbi:unnamed protein product, partial [Brassica oleracea]